MPSCIAYIPLDKSWMIRMGVLDLIHGYDDTITFLESQEELNDDLQALRRACLKWKSDEPVEVGESGTLYRFLKFASWKLGKNKQFILKGTLRERGICDNPKIVNWSSQDLLKLDNGTSQWASASVLLGNAERLDDAPFKLQLTYEAVNHWKQQREQGKCWEPRYDQTILKQARAFLALLRGEKPTFKPEQSEDYCFARAFDFITAKEGEQRWPSLRGHESDRIEEMERALSMTECDSKDHRVVQAIAMLQKVKGNPVKIKYPSAVNKTWPQFWRFLEYVENAQHL